MKELVLATRNQGKVEELRNLLQDLPVRIKSLHDFPELGELAETGTTFRENAAMKAEAVFAFTGLPAIADDSGLEVDYLQGQPGVYSARYAGEAAADADNNKKLLQALYQVPEEQRTARFRSVLCLITRDGQAIFTEGVCEGRIGSDLKGDQGFGYDPLFLVEPDFRQTMAELSLAAKNKVSHRARAFQQFKPRLAELLKEGGL